MVAAPQSRPSPAARAAAPHAAQAESHGRQEALAFASGLVFAVGLALAGMTQPHKVVGFLDVFGGAWDPSLAFVMGGAVAVYSVALRLITGRRQRPVYALKFGLPTRSDINPQLVVGAALFGAGWGLAGFCPGPAIVSTATLGGGVLVFAGAMVAGMLAFHAWDRYRARGR